MQEKRKNKRLDLEVSVELERLDEEEHVTTIKFVHVDVTDISRAGIGFHSSKEMAANTFYNAKIQIWTKEIINAVVQIVRCVPDGEDGYQCGGVFVGMQESDALKIDIYAIFNDEE